MLSNNPPMKLRDDLPIIACNSYDLVDGAYLHEGLFFFLLTPLFIGLGTSGND